MGDREGEPGTTWDAERTVRETRGGGDVIRLHGGGEARNRMRLKSRTRKQGNEGDGPGWFWSGGRKRKTRKLGNEGGGPGSLKAEGGSGPGAGRGIGWRSRRT